MVNIPQSIANAIVDPVAHGERQPFNEATAWLRREAPLAMIEPDGFDPFWAVTKHEDIRKIERMNDVFLNGGTHSAIGLPREAINQIKKISGGRPAVAYTLLEMDNPDHRAHRMLTQKEFMPISLKKLQGQIDNLSAFYTQKFIDMGGECDFAEDMAFLFPLRVVMEMLGVPEEDEPFMLELTQKLFGATDEDMNEEQAEAMAKMSDEEIGRVWMETHKKFFEYFDDIVADRRANPKDDLATILSNAKIDGEYVGTLALQSYFMVLAAAGHDSTSNSISCGMWKLAENPDLLAKLKANPELLDGFVHESVRFETPVRHFMRNAAVDVEFSGQQIKKGDWMMLSFASGNRDEDVFENPDEFNIERPNFKDHVGFGYGAHQCLGKYLAEMELKSFWSHLLPKFDQVEFNGTPDRVKANFVSGPKTLPVKCRLV